MTIKALLTSLVLGISTVAAAAPRVTPSTTASQGMWYAITEPMRLLRGRDVIQLATPHAYGQLRFQTTNGFSTIFSVDVMYTDGTHQSVALDAKLDVGNPMVQFAIDGTKRIDRIVVTGTSSRRGTVQLFGA